MLLALACSPKNEEVQTSHIETEKADSVADSIATTVKDGTATARPHETPALPLPQPVLQLLASRYPGWKEPVLLDIAKENASGKAQGPLTVQADFNGDTLQDIALQIQHGQDVVIMALLQDSGSWQLHELKKDILFNDRGTYKSPYHLYLTQTGEQLYNYDSNKNFTTEHDAVSVSISNSTITYLYEGNKFKAYETE